MEEINNLWAQAKFRGKPTENRLLVVTPIEATTKSGIFIPGSSDRDIIPKRGRIIQIGPISQEYRNYEDITVGDYAMYGLYAGKEVELPYLGIDSKKFVITILSITEVLYIENKE